MLGGMMSLQARAAIFAIALLATLSVSGAGQQPNGQREEQHLIQSLEGKSLFQAYCASCHGISGIGNGPAASALKKAPPDLTRIRERNGGNFPASKIQDIISGEEAVTPAHGSREMPIWGPIFSQIAWDQDLGKVRIYNLTRYIESLQKK
jgi:mono/diheme cytochrome c family protein